MYKSLNLNREKIFQTINKFFLIKGYRCSLSDFVAFGETRRRICISGDANIFIDFQFLKNGSTSIDLSSGGPNSLKIEIAQFIKEDPECSLKDVDSKNKWFVVKNIDKADLTAVIELLNECEFKKDYLVENNDRHRFVGIYDENLVITYYETTKTVMIQGRPLLLFNEAVIYLTELVELEDLPKTFNGYFNINVEKDDIEALYQYYFPHSYDKHSLKLQKVVHQALYNLQLEGDMYDYSFLIFPAFKALEGHLKITLHAMGTPLQDNKFHMFKRSPDGKGYNLDSVFHSNIGDAAKIKYLEKAYNFYNRQRHTLFHWADPSCVIDETRLIENMGEAKGLITDAISIIDEYYSL